MHNILSTSAQDNKGIRQAVGGAYQQPVGQWVSEEGLWLAVFVWSGDLGINKQTLNPSGTE